MKGERIWKTAALALSGVAVAVSLNTVLASPRQKEILARKEADLQQVRAQAGRWAREDALRNRLDSHQAWQPAKHRGAILRIVVRHNLPHWLVVCDHTHGWWLDAKANRLAVDLDLVAILDALADMGRLVVYRDAPFQDHLFHLDARAQSGLGQHLVQLWCFRLWQKYPFGHRYIGPRLVLIEGPRNHVGKPVALSLGCSRRSWRLLAWGLLRISLGWLGRLARLYSIGGSVVIHG